MKKLYFYLKSENQNEERRTRILALEVMETAEIANNDLIGSTDLYRINKSERDDYNDDIMITLYI